MAKYKISELAQLWGCSVPTATKRAEKLEQENEAKIVRDLDEQNKMVKYVIMEDVNNVENVENNVVNEVENDVIEIKPEKQQVTQANEFIKALMTLTKEHEHRLEEKNEELMRYKASALLLEEKKYTEGQLIQENMELKREKKDLQKVNDYFKYAIFASIVIIVGLLVFFIR